MVSEDPDPIVRFPRTSTGESANVHVTSPVNVPAGIDSPRVSSAPVTMIIAEKTIKTVIRTDRILIDRDLNAEGSSI